MTLGRGGRARSQPPRDLARRLRSQRGLRGEERVVGPDAVEDVRCRE